MSGSLNPTALQRLHRRLRPDWLRTVVARRILAGALVLLAGAAAWRADPRDDLVEVVVAARDLSAGSALTAEDVRLEHRSPTTLPDGARTRIDDVAGNTLSGAARRGEVLTDVRVLGPRLTESLAGPGARIAAVSLADAALVDLLRAGDVVDVVSAPTSADTGAEARVIARDAVVVLVSTPGSGITAANANRVVLIALSSSSATVVASAALTQTVTLTLH
ncbi:flagellar biosynthesis protein FlgA [Mycolicibacterium sp. 018/SC-01/001]|uniref:SAF domain-containing protein n=1 Tax=Mycolicibacterium sp. 018/SC-01/001 TaxID=2592069 RepID=UPI001180387D|nr:SAF domain-containing protein [Mycolicibacterium sp. 018/SC-01/001]TRW82000.1 flagellar biosynthesis protein FlgA [Mycolicibacterium sp. 018/SC-01/001]